MSVRIGIVDYGMGNRRSVQKALEHVGTSAVITSDREELRATEGLVLPGVGAFPKAMNNLTSLGLDGLIREQSKPLLGICLGMQLLFESSEELGHTAGLGLIPGSVRPLRSDGLRVPHIGWNEVRPERPSPLTANLPAAGCPFYHVHSFAAWPADPANVIGTCEYGERFASIVSKGSVFGVQFHPEKSSADGLALLANFVRLCAPAARVGGGRAAAA